MSAAFAGPRWLSYILSALARTVLMAATLVPAALIYQAVASDPADIDEDNDDDDDDDE